MKRKSLLFLLLMAVFAPWAANAQETLTVYQNETGTSRLTPIYNYYFDAYTRAQTVFPAEDLADMNGAEITAIKFYTSMTYAYETDVDVDVYLTEVESSTISSFVALSDATVVYTGSLSFELVDGKAEVTITLTTPYTYHGGNLLFGCDNQAKGDYESIYYYGKSATGASIYGNNSSATPTSSSAADFLPKTTFTYELNNTDCPNPKTLVASDENAHGATMTWTMDDETAEYQFNLEYKKTTEEGWTRIRLGNVRTYPLTDLVAETEYQVRIQTACEPENTYWKNLNPNFTTTVACPAPTGLEVAEASITTNEATATWTGTSESYVVSLGVYDFTATPNEINVEEDFESGTMPTGWTHIGSGSASVVTPGSSHTHDGKALQFQGATSNNVVVLPEFEVEANALTIDFWSHAEGSSSGSFDLGYVTDATDASTFVALDTYTSSQHGSFTHVENFSLAAAPAGARIAFRHRSGQTYWYWFIDDVTVSGVVYPINWTEYTTNNQSYPFANLTPNTSYQVKVKGNCGDEGYSTEVGPVSFTTTATCVVPEGLAINDMVATWNAGTASKWNLQYKKTADDTWTAVEGLTATTYDFNTLTLEANTSYDVQVQADCGDNGLSDWTETKSFLTPCDAISSFPKSYGFETSEGFPSNVSTPTTNQLGQCWRNEATVQTGSYATRVWGTSTTNKHGGSQALVLPDKGNGSRTMLTFPEMNFTSANGYTVSFWIYRNGTSTNPEGFKVYVSDTDTISANAVELGHYSRNYTIAYPVIESASGWYKYEIDIPAATMTGNAYLIFEGQSYYGNATYVDDITIKETVTVTANQIVNTVSDPATEMTWEEFATHLNNGDRFTNTTITLMDDITVSTMVGTSENPFTGTFEGGYKTITFNYTATDDNFTAPFRIVRGATIQNLKVDGTINDGGHKFCAGLAGDCYGTNTITNCVSDVTINATYAGDGTHGGFAARIGTNSASNIITFNGCAFTGSLLGESTSSCGGFVGYNYNSTGTFNNCVFAPAEVTMSDASCATFSRTGGSVTATNSYYTQAFGTAQGKQMYTITAESSITMAMSGESASYNMSGIDAYAEGIIYSKNIYAGEGDNVTLTLSGAPGYAANHGTLTANGETYTLLMEAYDTEISAVECPVPYNVEDNNVEARSADISWIGNSDSYTLQYREVITAPVDVNVTYGFEDGTQGWTTIDADGHGDAWSRNSSNGYNSSYCMRATYNSYYAHQDYLVSPEITLGGTLSFYAKKGGNYSDNFRVYLSTSGNTSASDFTIELTDGDVTPTTAYELYSYDLSSYSGTGYVAIVYTAAADQYYLYVDDITYTNTIEGEYGEWQTVENAVSPKPLSSLSPETTYQVKVMGTCSGVDTDYSEPIEFTTPASCPKPTDLVVTEGSVTVHEAIITWTENGEATTWIVEYADNVDFTGALTETVEDNATYSFDGLDGEITYYVRVKAHCGEEDESTYSDGTYFTTLDACPAPTNFILGEVTESTAAFSWTQPTNGVEINEWVVKYRKSGETEWQTLTHNPTTPSATIENLDANAGYEVVIAPACNEEKTLEDEFDTPCAIHTLPYTYGFEDAAEFNCWTMTDCNSSSGIYSSANHSGNKCFYFYYEANSQQCLISPEFNCTTEMGVSFYYKNSSTNYDETFHVGYSTTTNDVDAFEWGDEIFVDKANTSWLVYTNTFPAGTKFVAIKHTSDDAFYLYLDDFTFAEPISLTKEIEPYTGEKDNYYLIASPLAYDVDPTTIEGMTEVDYDLYYFDQTQNLEWRNHKDTEVGGYKLINGKGYLYANNTGNDITFAGVPYVGNGTVTLTKTENAVWSGWNLVGNPFSTTATIERGFYRMNEETGDEIIPGSGEINVMEGVFVEAESNGETMTFSTESGVVKVNNDQVMAINLNMDNILLDRAMVYFGGERKLSKFQLNPNHTKVYIPMDDKDYAVVSAGEVGEMPVSFKAEKNGSYTLSFTSQEVSFSYLHLIDNMTGNDVNLLKTPSYTFDATTTDYAQRFRLVFATGSSVDGDNFGFVNAMGNLCIFGIEGEATLQVIDVTGRVIISNQFSGSYESNLNVAPGVYMLRLINGNDVKVQKIVME